eukprot:IDg8301t1
MRPRAEEFVEEVQKVARDGEFGAQSGKAFLFKQDRRGLPMLRTGRNVIVFTTRLKACYHYMLQDSLLQVVSRCTGVSQLISSYSTTRHLWAGGLFCEWWAESENSTTYYRSLYPYSSSLISSTKRTPTHYHVNRRAMNYVTQFVKRAEPSALRTWPPQAWRLEPTDLVFVAPASDVKRRTLE